MSDVEDQQHTDQADFGREDADLERPPELTPHGPSPPFKVVSDLFEEISLSSTKRVTTQKPAERKKSYLERFFQLYRSRCGKDLFPVVRLLVPDRDRQRSTYGCKEQVLAKLYIEALGLDKNLSSDANRLLNWKQPAPGEVGAGDFAEIAYNLIRSRSSMIGATGRLTIDDVNTQLDLLSRARDFTERKRIISHFFNNTSPVEQKWIIRIILKDLKIAVRERTVLYILHHDAVPLFNICSDLRRVCWTLWDENYSLPSDDKSVKMFMAFRPMLSKRNEKSLDHIVRAMMRDNTKGYFYIEEKMDGERIQLHKRNDDYRYYSRNDKDYSSMYGKTPRDKNGALTQFITSCFKSEVEEIILDGEMMVYDPVSELFTPFGYLKSAALDKSNNPDKPRACFKVFDVLYLKIRGHQPVQLLTTALSERRRVLQTVLVEKKGYLEPSLCVNGKNAADIRAALDRVLDNNGEGLVVKHPGSVYVLNGREDTWCKVKPDYMDALGETFDVTCIGGFWGSGKRGGNFGSFITGVLDEQTGDYLSFSKVGSGLSLSHLNDITKYFSDKWKEMPRKKQQQPPGLKFRSERPDVYIDPADSFVLTIKAAEILTDPEGMASGLCLRFPRIERVWTGDLAKDPLGQLTFADLIGKKEAVSTRKRRVISENLDGHKKRKFNRTTKRAALPAELTLGPDLSDVTVRSEVFKGIAFYVIDGLPKTDKKALEKIVYANGGRFVQTVPNVTPRRIVSRVPKSMQGSSLIDKGHSLISPQWIVDCDQEQSCLPLDKYYVHRADDLSFDEGDGAVTEEDEEMDVDEPARAIQVDDTDDEDDFATLRDVRRVVPDSEDDDEEELPTKTNKRTEKAARSAADQSWEAASSPVPARDADEESEDESGVQQRYIAQPPGGMGADDPEANDYDPDLIFKHLVFFLDTQEHAAALKLPCSAAVPASHPLFTQTANFLKKGGGKLVTDICEPTITHIVFAKKDTSRMQALRRFSHAEKTRERRLVTTDWVLECQNEDALVPEQNFAPRPPTKPS